METGPRLSLIRQTGEAVDQARAPWFTRRVFFSTTPQRLPNFGTFSQVGKVSTNFAAAKNGKVGSNFSAAKNGQVSSNSKKR